MLDGAVVGTVTSADWGHRIGENLAYAYVNPELAVTGTRMEIDMYGHLVSAEVIAPSPYDPRFGRMRS